MLLRHKDVAASLGQREGALAHPEVDDAKAFVRQLALCTAKLNEGDREILLALVGCAMAGDFTAQVRVAGHALPRLRPWHLHVTAVPLNT